MLRTNHGAGTGNGWTGRKPSLVTGLRRGVLGRCPRCGCGELFNRWVTMVDDCPRCGMHFERSQGYWLGSMVINLGVTFGVFVVALVGGMMLTWPDVPWAALTAVLVGLMIAVPFVFNPIARTLWVALERHVRSRSEPYM